MRTTDPVDNRLTSRLGTATDGYTYPATSNRLSMINLATGGTRGFTYDAAGNVTAEARPGGTYGYTYNAAGRMSEFRINGILQASYKYDAMGRQAIRTLSSPTAVTIHSVFDSQGRRIAEYNAGTSALIREYVWNGWGEADQTNAPVERFPAERPSTPAGAGVAVIEGRVISFVRASHIARPVFATNSAGGKTWTATPALAGVLGRWGASTPPPERPPPPACPASGSRANPASTRTECATTIRRRGGTSRPTRWSTATSLTPSARPAWTPPQIPIPTFRPSWNA